MLKKIRRVLAVVFFLLITLLFLDFTGTIQSLFGWMAKIQFLPSVLALNFVVIALLIALTIIFGRIYCSIICPLGVLQDLFAWFGKKQKKNRYSYSKAKNWLRYGVLGLFIIAIVAGIVSFVALLAPYSSYGRIAQNLFAPVYYSFNNILAYFAERVESYAFYSKEIWIKSIPTFVIAITTFILLLILAWRNGRTYCNTICPVGTILGCFARFSIFKPIIDKDKCVNCSLCVKNCKSSCIDIKEHKIDYSRCVACGDCITVCNKAALTYSSSCKKNQKTKVAEGSSAVDDGRRKMMAIAGALTTASILKAQDKIVDGGLELIVEKQEPEREKKIVPPGAKSLKNMVSHCTGCQLCVSVCPNNVLKPSNEIMTLMQPRSSYEKGYCRPECTKCSEVCPAGAIVKITKEEKSSIQIGHAVWDSSLCLPMINGTHCGNCARHCPAGAIEMINIDPTDDSSPKFPVVNEERCIGCGACEYVCPSRPNSAIYVEGHEVHRVI